MKNHIRLMVASNNDWVIPAGPEERRFCVLDVSDRHTQDHEYFKPLFDQMDNGGMGIRYSAVPRIADTQDFRR